MTDDNSNTELVDISDNLDDFENEFFQKEVPEKETTKEDPVEEVEEEVEDTEDDALATDEDKDAPEGDEDSDPDEEEEEQEDSDDESEEDEEDEEPEPKPKGKGKKSAQERINELTRQKHEEARRAAAIEQQNAELLRRLEALEAGERKDSKSEPIKEQLPQGAPKPDALDSEGEPKYPLGEFDPAFITDLTRFTIEYETTQRDQKKAEETAAKERAEAQEAIRTSWNKKLEAKEEENPDIRENIEGLVSTFQNLDPQYGEYLATTIMTSEVGPDIMEYLSDNIGEAQKIVASGPAAATLAIGRLEARLSKPSRPEAEEKRNSKKVSKAPAPPEKVTRGRKGQRHVSGDTDDLDAFERVYFQ